MKLIAEWYKEHDFLGHVLLYFIMFPPAAGLIDIIDSICRLPSFNHFGTPLVTAIILTGVVVSVVEHLLRKLGK